ncbi:hypothetical protein A3709_20860 [Halioglobus sp. HI00S01]|nr:hypothetical protein A3709_20860 [Halioglobus sp. HI00S01]
MNMLRKFILGAAVFGTLSAQHSSAAFEVTGATAESQGHALAVAQKEQDAGWGTMTSTMTMTLRNGRGGESVRVIRSQALEVPDDGDLSLIVFDKPADVSGTAFLTHSHITEPDDQWLYMTAIKRVKRINARRKSGPFMGSEFSYEDMSSFEVEKFTYRYEGEEDYQGRPHHILESYPADQYSGYSKKVSWVDADNLTVSQVHFYNKAGVKFKTLTATDYSQYEGRYWRAARYEMINHQTGKTTEIGWDDITFGVDLDKRDFTKSALKRAR